MAYTRAQIENAILDSTGRPDTGVIRDNLDAIVNGVFNLLEPEVGTTTLVKEAKVESKSQETR